MIRSKQRLEKAKGKGLSYIMAELNMWANKYKEGGHVPKSVKRRVARLVVAQNELKEMLKVAKSVDQSELDKKIAEYEKKDLTPTA